MQQTKINRYAMAMTLFTLAAQGVHSYFTFYGISQYQNWFGHGQAVWLALAVVGGILFFSIYEPPSQPLHIKYIFPRLRNKKKFNEEELSLISESWESICFFLVRVEVVINLYYHGMAIFSNGWQAADAGIIPVALTLDFTVPYLIYRYSSHIIKKTDPEPKFEPGPEEGYDPKAPFGWNKNGLPKAPYGRRQDGKTPRKTPKR